MIELNTIIQGDCLEVMRTLPSESVDVVVTSPPYNLGKVQKNYCIAGAGKNKMVTESYDLYNDNLPDEQYVAWQRACLTEMMRLIKPTGAIFYNHKPRIQNGLLNDRYEIVNGLPVRQVIIWQRDGGLAFNNSFFLPSHEYIFFIPKPKFKLREKANSLMDVWKISQQYKNKSDHPCPFPPEIPRRCIASSLHNQVVLDPFCGSGTTCAVAKSLGCDYIGIELSEKYCQMARERCDNVTRFFEPLNAELF